MSILSRKTVTFLATSVLASELISCVLIKLILNLFHSSYGRGFPLSMQNKQVRGFQYRVSQH